MRARMVRTMRQEDRLGLILQYLNEHGSVGVTDLASRLDVSEASVRRDLHLLEIQKLLTRTHGGAVASGVLYELPMRYRGGQQYEAKRAIAAAVALLLPADVGTVGLNGGTTTTEVARAIASRNGLRVVTNALNIASELAVRSNIELVVCGGSARSESYELVGPLADLTLANINLDIAVLGRGRGQSDRRLHDPPRGGSPYQPGHAARGRARHHRRRLDQGRPTRLRQDR